MSSADPNNAGSGAELRIVDRDAYEAFLREAIGCTVNEWRGFNISFSFGWGNCGYMASRLDLGLDMLFQTDSPRQNEPIQLDWFFKDSNDYWSTWSSPLTLYGEYKAANGDTTFRVVARNNASPQGSFLIVNVDGLVSDADDFDTSLNVTVEYAGKTMARGTVYRHW